MIYSGYNYEAEGLKNQMQSGIIFNIQKFCLHDGDGIRTCVFLKGCPLRCIWCHNPESIEKKPCVSFDAKKCTLCGKCIEVCSSRKITDTGLFIDRKNCTVCGSCNDVCLSGANEICGYEISAEDVMAEVLKDKIFYDTSSGGITVTGGEPSYQPDFTLEILRLAKEAGISPAIETCGIGTEDFYSKANKLGTTFLFDVKCISPEKHRKFTGVDNAHIMSNLKFLMEQKADIIIRLPLIPGCNDTDRDIEALAEFLNENKRRYRYAEIMPYHSLGTAKSEKLGKTAEYIHCDAADCDKSRWLEIFSAHGTEIRISE